MNRRIFTTFRQLLIWLMIFTLTSLMVTYTLLVYNGDKTFSGICNIPQLDPWDASIMKYLPSKSAKLPCPEALNILYLNDSGFILYNESALQYYSLNSKHLGCTYQTVVRSLGDTDVKFGPRKELKLPTFVNSNVFRVSCSTDKKLVYDLLHLNPFWVENQERDNEIGLEDDDHYSVLLIGIDSVSRSHALRNLPKPYKYLTEILGAYDFKGYMRVGSNAFPNLAPLNRENIWKLPFNQ